MKGGYVEKSSLIACMQKSCTEQVLDACKRFNPFAQIISALQTPQDFPFKEGKEKRKGKRVFTNTIILRGYCQEAIETCRP